MAAWLPAVAAVAHLTGVHAAAGRALCGACVAHGYHTDGAIGDCVRSQPGVANPHVSDLGKCTLYGLTKLGRSP